MKSKWLDWKPGPPVAVGSEPTKPTKLGSVGFVGESAATFPITNDDNAVGKPVQSNGLVAPNGQVKNFDHLHVHTDYSLLDGACDITKLVSEAARHGMPAVAVTDHGNLFAAEQFYDQALAHRVKPIIGCEVYVARGSRHERKIEAGQRGVNHLVLLCENAEGYRNLSRLVSAGFLEGFYYKPRIDYDLLAQHSRGLLAPSACLSGVVAEPLLEQRYDDARNAAHRLRDIFGKDNFFLEVQDQGLDVDGPVNRDLVRLSRENGALWWPPTIAITSPRRIPAPRKF